MEAEADKVTARTGSRWSRPRSVPPSQPDPVAEQPETQPPSGQSTRPDRLRELLADEEDRMASRGRKRGRWRGRKDSARRRGRGRDKAESVPLLTREGAMEDGGLAIIDKQGEVRHIAPGPVAASLRYFVARLQQRGSGGVPRRMAFTSALGGEGVSFIANSFAAILAHDLGKRVCVIDVNWWPERADAETAWEDQPGILDVLYRGVEIREVLIATQSPDLWMLPAGRAPVSVRSALAYDDDLVNLLAALDQEFDHLVFDLPAVLVTSDAVALAGLTDGFGLVVRHGTTTDSQVRAALADLEAVPSFGVILNQTRTSIPRLVRRLVGL